MKPKRMSAHQFNAWLEKFGLTQVAFSRMVNVDDRSVRRWCSGERHVPPWMGNYFDYLERTRNSNAFRDLMKRANPT